MSKEDLQKQLKEVEEMIKKTEVQFHQLTGQKFLLLDLIKKADEKKKEEKK